MNNNTQFSLKLLFVSFLLLVCGINQAQTKLVVCYHDQSEETYLLSEDGRLFFEAGNLIIEKGTDSPIHIQTSSIGKLLVSEVQEEVTSLPDTEDSRLTIYPNPAGDYISIQGDSTETTRLSIYSVAGQLIYDAAYSMGSPIDVSQLRQGVYLVRLGNGFNTTLKFCKQ